jgi:hypothetical protein
MSADQVGMDNLLNGARTTSEMLAEGAMLLRGFVAGAEAVYIYETM